MPGAATTIRSGTRDELGGVDVGIANVWERDERPGVLSVLLVADDRQHILAAGDRVELGGHAYTLEAIALQSGGGYDCRFRQIDELAATPPTPASQARPLQPLQPADLARRLRERSALVLAALGASPGLTISWDHTSRDTYHREWNGEETGPITNLAWTAKLPDMEARVGLDLVRYNPGDLHRAEVSAFWKVGDRHVSLFARAEGNADLDHVLLGGAVEAILGLLDG